MADAEERKLIKAENDRIYQKAVEAQNDQNMATQKKFLVFGRLLVLSKAGSFQNQAYFTHTVISGTFSLSSSALPVAFTQPVCSSRHYIMCTIKVA